MALTLRAQDSLRARRSRRLKGLGVAFAAVAALVAPQVIAVATAPPAQASETTVVSSWRDAGGRTVILRQGAWSNGSGWGWFKIRGKHNIHDIRAVRFVTQNPVSTPRENQSREYSALAYRIVWNPNGTVARYERRTVIAGVSFQPRYTPYKGNSFRGQPIGVLTTYCDQGGAPLCPWWVSRALAGTLSSINGGSSTDGDGSSNYDSGTNSIIAGRNQCRRRVLERPGH